MPATPDLPTRAENQIARRIALLIAARHRTGRSPTAQYAAGRHQSDSRSSLGIGGPQPMSLEAKLYEQVALGRLDVLSPTPELLAEQLFREPAHRPGVAPAATALQPAGVFSSILNPQTHSSETSALFSKRTPHRSRKDHQGTYPTADRFPTARLAVRADRRSFWRRSRIAGGTCK